MQEEPQEYQGSESFWTDGRVKLAGGGAVALAMLIGLHMRFSDDLELPPMPPKPVVVSDEDALRHVDENPEVYREGLATDAATYEVKAMTTEDMEKVLPYEQVTATRLLGGADSTMETGSLRLTVRNEMLEMRMGREGNATLPHLILRIENKTDAAIAYNVTTDVAGSARRCGEKADLEGNMLALPPHAFVDRTECIFLKGMKLEVQSVEAIQLQPLAFHYVSRLNPAHIGLDKRLAFAHRVPMGKMCTTIPEQAIKSAMKDAKTTWRDLIDFYARHNCDTYSFPIGYHAFTRPKQYVLPVTPERVD